MFQRGRCDKDFILRETCNYNILPLDRLCKRDEHADISQERCSQAGNLRANVFDIGFTILNRSEKMKQDKLGRSNLKKK